MAYYDVYTVDQLKNEIERLNRDIKTLDKAYEDLILFTLDCIKDKKYNDLLKWILESEYFEKEDIIELLIEERMKNE